MSWRTIVITKRAKLDLQLGFMVVRGEDTTKVALNEIAVVLIESTAVSLTTSLLAELMKRKVKVIFCDEKRNPSSELVSYYGSHDTSNKIRKQIAWRQNTKEAVWTEIVSEKIRKQKELLELLGKEEAELLSSYLQQIAWNDETNREGHAAKVYFNALFGLDFTRTEDNLINAALNYGYSIILSSFTREIVANVKTQEMKQYLQEYLLQLEQETDYILDLADEIDFASLFKAFGIKYEVLEENFLERLVRYMRIVERLLKKKLFVFVNLRSYLSNQQIDELIKEATYQEIQLLLIETCARDCIEGVTRYIIDKDGCEI